MIKQKVNIYSTIDEIIGLASTRSIPEDREVALQVLVDYIVDKVQAKEEVNLNFICTHNSRRSQFSQIWAKVASVYHGVDINSFSGGVEVTEFNERAVNSIERFGFKVEKEGEENPIYSLYYSDDVPPIKAFSKLHDDESSPAEHFATVMTCAHADENCPYIPGAERRISVRYDDPKAFDDTELETPMYDERSLQIATEMLHVFKAVKREIR